MCNLLTEAIETLKQLPEQYLEKALEAIQELKNEHKKEKKCTPPPCPKCKGKRIVRNGNKRGKQSFLCRSCGRSFIERSQTIMLNSHSGESVWKQVLKDTINGVPLKKTATNLHLHNETVFNMRHKILFSIEANELNNPTKLSGVCEADETYVLESYKGSKFPDDFWRKPRKHGAIAKKRGLSKEYICICTGVERDGNAVAVAVNRANATRQDIDDVFSERVNESTLLLSDEAKVYHILDKKCKVHETKKKSSGFYNINTVNSYHSFLKEKNRNARGFATKYLNRYNCLFSRIFRKTEVVADQIYDLLCDMNHKYHTNKELRVINILVF